MKSLFKKISKQKRWISQIFDADAVKAHKIYSVTHGSDINYLKEEITENIIERMDFINKKFSTTLEFFSGDGFLYQKLPASQNGIDRFIMTDTSTKLLTFNEKQEKISKVYKIAFTDDLFPIKEKSIDLCIAANGLHFINDLEKFFVNTHKILKPDGAFVGAVIGGDSLIELRTSFLFAEQERGKK